MVTLIASLVLTLTSMQPAPSLLKKHIPSPTGANAFEEYLQAADLVAGSNVRVYKSWLDYRSAVARGFEWEEVPRVPPGLDLKSTPLDVRREVARRFGRVVDLVHAGNAKPAIPFRSHIDMDTAFDELTHYKTIGWVLDCAAYTAFAEGATGKAVGILLDQVSFATAISAETLIGYLVGRAIQAVALARFEAQLSALSLSDAARIERYCGTYLEQPDPYIACLEGEKRFMLQGIPSMLEQPDTLTLFGSDDDWSAKAQTAIKNLSKADRDRAARLIAERIERAYEPLIARFRGPESKWYTTSSAEEVIPREITTIEDLADCIVVLSMPIWDVATQTVLRNRCQLRLLRLHCQVIAFRWKHERLPTKLAEAVPEAELADPLSGEAFQFELRDGGYRLYSKGIPATGEIELRYRRPPSTDDEGIRPPPFGP